jgi:hypothetical protein
VRVRVTVRIRSRGKLGAVKPTWRGMYAWLLLVLFWWQVLPQHRRVTVKVSVHVLAVVGARPGSQACKGNGLQGGFLPCNTVEKHPG